MGKIRNKRLVFFVLIILLSVCCPQPQLRSQAPKENVEIRIPDGSYVRAIAFSPNGILASGSDDKLVHLWDTSTGKQVKILKGHKDGIVSIAFSLDGKLVSAKRTYKARLWDTATWKQIKFLNVHKYIILSIAISPDGKTLASGGENVRLWDINTGRQGKVLEVKALTYSVAFNPDGKTLAVGGGNIEIWDYKKGRLLATLIAFSDGEWVTYTPDNYYICSENGEDYISFLVNNKLIINRYDFPDYKNEEALKKSLGQHSFEKNAAISPQLTVNKTDHKNANIYSHPVVNIKFFKIDARNLPPVSQTVSVSPVKIVARAVEQVSEIEKIIVQLDGKTVFETSAANQKSFKLETSIPIKKGENRIKVTALNSEGLSGHSEEIILTLQPVSQPTSQIVAIAFEQNIPTEWSGSDQLIINGNKVNVHRLDLHKNTIEVTPLSGSESKGIISKGLNFIGSLLSDARESYLFWKEKSKLKRFEKPYKDSHAILVAIDDYDRRKDPKKRGKTGFKDFHGDMVKKAEQLKSILLFLGFPRDNIQTFYDQEAESESVLKALKEFWVKSTDRLFFYFSGHGYMEKSNQNGYLVTYDYDPHRLSTTTIPMEDLTLAHAREIKAHHMLIALDSCYSGLALPQSMHGADNEAKMKEFKSLSIIRSAVEPKARNVMLASTGSEEAFARNGGIFTKHLINGLKGFADYNRDKVIQLEELSLYVKNHVIAETSQMGLRQEPVSYITSRFGRGKVVFILPQWTK